MKAEYTQWIAAYEAEHGELPPPPRRNDAKLKGKCHEASLAMGEAFPELRLAVGDAILTTGVVPHWWLMTPEGEVVDPTAVQFPWGYVDYDENTVLTRKGPLHWDATCTNGQKFDLDMRRYKDLAPKYQRWIMKYVAWQRGFVRGRCDRATALMVEQFPELKRQPGFVHCSWGADQHWWCVTEDGVIVDPTANQFPGTFHYDPIDVTNPEDVKRIPIGVCANCSADIYPDSECTNTVCSEACHRAYVAYCNSARYAEF